MKKQKIMKSILQTIISIMVIYTTLSVLQMAFSDMQNIYFAKEKSLEKGIEYYNSITNTEDYPSRETVVNLLTGVMISISVNKAIILSMSIGLGIIATLSLGILRIKKLNIILKILIFYITNAIAALGLVFIITKTGNFFPALTSFGVYNIVFVVGMIVIYLYTSVNKKIDENIK